jgi:hypothetical protein
MAVLLQGGRRAIAFSYLQALAPQPLTAAAARIAKTTKLKSIINGPFNV